MARTLLLIFLATSSILAIGEGTDPILERQELMEGTRDALKPMVGMVRGETDFDASVVTASLETFRHTAEQAGGLFPPGSETGHDTEARPEIWTDREGFDARLADFNAAVTAAIDAGPESLDELKPVLGDVTKTCKGCHDNYRVEHEHD